MDKERHKQQALTIKPVNPLTGERIRNIYLTGATLESHRKAEKMWRDNSFLEYVRKYGGMNK